MIENMTSEEIRAFLRIGKTKLYQVLNDPDFPSFRIGGRIYANREEVKEWQRKQVDLYRQEKGRV